jgi:DNA-binding NarL/FixJ family response regulator
MIRVLIVDGQAEVRRGLRMRLGIEPDLTVVGETGNDEEALALAQTLDPDVVVIDVGRPDPDSVNIIRYLRQATPTASVVVLSLQSDEDTRARVHAAGAHAFLEKCGGAADLLQAIRQLAARRLLGTDRATTDPPAVRRQSVGCA